MPFFSCHSESVDAPSTSQISSSIPPSQLFVQVPLNEIQRVDTSAELSSIQHEVKVFVETDWESVDWVSTGGACLVDDASDSDIMWISDLSSVDGKRLKPSQCIVRFVGDECLTHKDKLLKTLR